MNRRTLRRAASRALDTLPAGAGTARRAGRGARRERDVRFVAETGIFDRPWYEAQSGLSFDSDTRAIRHYLARGRKKGFSPHPLFEPSSASRTWKKSTADPFVVELRRGRGKRGRPHPVSILGTAATKVDFASWARTATAKTPVPVAGGPSITWNKYRAAALQIAVDERVQWHLATAADPVRTRPRFLAGDDWPMPVADPSAPAVSIVMATWNRARLLPRAVASVQAQQLGDWELIIVDDGSDDDTALVLEGMAARDPRIRPVLVDHGGVCRARNAGLAAARGRYIAFLDSDNTWTPQFLRAAVAFADDHDAQWAHAGIEMRRGDTVRWRSYEGDRRHLLAGNYIDLNVVLARRDSLTRAGGFDESLRRAVDYDLVLRLSELAPPRLIPVLGAIYRQDDDDENRISVAEPFSWNVVVKHRHLVREAKPAEPVTVPGRTTILVPVRTHPGSAATLIAALASTHGDIEVVVVLCGATDWAGRVVRCAVINRPNVHVISRPGEFNYAAAVDLGAARASGDVLVAWRPNCRPLPGWLPPLRSALESSDVGVVQPLNRTPEGLVDSAGAVFVPPDVMPSPLLTGMPVEDAAMPAVSDIPAVLSDVFAMRTVAYHAAGGLDALFGNSFAEVDLSLRLRDAVVSPSDDEPGAAPEAEPVVAATRSVLARTAMILREDPVRGGFLPDPAASVRVLRRRHVAPPGSAAVWQSLDFELLGRSYETLPAGPRGGDDEASVPLVRPRVSENPDRLRWAIDIAAPAGPSGDQWGDWHFAESLARSLRKLGQQVHVDRREARDGAHRAYDDVTLVLRGLDDVRPRPGSLSMLWVISHPDLVCEAEAAAHDVVFAASEFWAETTSARWGLPVTPLLQCTDADLFRFGAGEPDTGPEFVFVGNSRGIRRFAVVAALDAGLPLQLYGRGWQNLVPDDALLGEYVANHELPALYGSAGVVFNDHWDDMRHDGFVSNRTFDVLAAGGRLVSDDVPGLEHLVGDAVAIFRSHLDLTRLFEGEWRTRFPDLEGRRALSERVRAEHSFDARAQTLLDTALALRSARGSGD